MDRREFLKLGAAGLALSSAHGFSDEFADRKAKRVGLIGCGWYGKCDLFRLLQVAPVEVVSLCDVDQHMLGLRAGDALHLATASEHGATVHTLDRRLAEAGPVLGVPTRLLA